MKSIIVSTGKRKSIALTDDGQFVTVNTKKNYQEGTEVNYINHNIKTVTSVAAVLVVMLLASFLVSYNIPSYSITLDVNPSLEFYVNVFNKVIDVNGMNEDGEYVLNRLDYKNNELKEVLANSLAEIEKLGFIKDDYVVVIGVDGSEAQVLGINDIVNTLKEEAIITTDSVIPEGLNKNINNEKSQIIVGRITEDMREASNSLGVSPGKLVLITKANEQGASLEYSDATYLSVQEIQKVNKINSFVSKMKEKATDNENEKKDVAIEKMIVKEIEKLEDSLQDLLIEIENSEEVENNAPLDRYITLTEQLHKVYSIVNATSADGNGTKSVGYEAAKAKVEARKAEKAVKIKENDDPDTESDDVNGNDKSNQGNNKN